MILEPKKTIPLLGIEHGMTVMDIGSGIGFWAKLLAERVGASGTIIAIDNHSETITRLNNDARELGLTMIQGIAGDIHQVTELPIRKHSCDRILMIRMITIVERNIMQTIQDLAQYLKDSGQIIIIDHQSYYDDIVSAVSVSGLEMDEIPLIGERSGGHFFGMSIRRTVLD